MKLYVSRRSDETILSARRRLSTLLYASSLRNIVLLAMSEFETAAVSAEVDIQDADEYYKFQTYPLELSDAQRAEVEDQIRFNKLLSSLGQDFIVKGEVHLNNVERFLMVTITF